MGCHPEDEVCGVKSDKLVMGVHRKKPGVNPRVHPWAGLKYLRDANRAQQKLLEHHLQKLVAGQLDKFVNNFLSSSFTGDFFPEISHA
jgi:hypothetical protein